jgi:hypothetical protein
MDAAVLGGPDTSERPWACEHGWFFTDGGGGWAEVVLLSDGRAVLTGLDHEASETYFAGVDLRQGLPQWALPYVPHATESGAPRWGFVAVYDGQEWRSPDYGVSDGLEESALPILSEERMLEAARDWFEGAAEQFHTGGDPREKAEVDPAAVERAAALGPGLDAEALRDVLVYDEVDLEAGVAAARAFADVTPIETGLPLPYRVGT